MEEAPLPILQRMEGYAVAALAGLVLDLIRGGPSRVLAAVLHLLLLKKEPYWLIRKSRPILLEAAFLRLTSAIMFARVQHRAEMSGWLPPSSFAYRKKLSP